MSNSQIISLDNWPESFKKCTPKLLGPGEASAFMLKTASLTSASLKDSFSLSCSSSDRVYLSVVVTSDLSYMIYIYIFYHDFAKIYGPPEILQNYTSVVMAHGVRDITPWPAAVGAASSGPLVWDRHSVVPHGVRSLAPWATALCPRAMGHGGSRPARAVGHGARVWLPI
jgi:hypothetical protein